ncbi:hypothetical protein LSCM1_03293 [Leishmania martiniquensis]|uniref:Uncharacterized protein n=1 Tax=Leishmania martiniquensis TaxID=1580590 RepID=A0A836G3N6_9TRYP|nr:hypothetical protein LSCM1_03293 [Leishmania martiniquensis]
MHDEQLHCFRRYTRVFPATAYAHHTPRVGCSVATDARHTPSTSPASSASRTGSVRVVALLCSKMPPRAITAGTTPKKRSTSSPTPPAESRKHPREDCVDDGDASALSRTYTAPSKPPRGADGKREGPDADDLYAPALSGDPPVTVASSAAVHHEAETRTTVTNAVERSSPTAASCGASEPEPTASLYVRVQYDKTLITTLPIEVMRVQHPQVLIDYLLSMSVWA